MVPLTYASHVWIGPRATMMVIYAHTLVAQQCISVQWGNDNQVEAMEIIIHHSKCH